MATTRKLSKDQWGSYFDTFSRKFLRGVNPEDADIKVLSPEIGAQEGTRHARLQGITYDRKDNVLEILLKNHDHLVFDPQEVWVDEEDNGFVNTIEIVRKDDTREIIELRQVGIRQAGS